MPTDVTIEKGAILAYRVFDVAEECHLPKVEQILRERGATERLRIARNTGHAFVMKNPPVLLQTGETAVRIGGDRFTVPVYAKVWDYGVITVLFQVPLQKGIAWHDLVDLASRVEDDNDFDEAGRRVTDELMTLLAPALVAPHAWVGIEDYVIYFLEEMGGLSSPADLFDAVDVPALILGEPSTQLSSKIRGAIRESVFQYSENDLAVIDWNSAVLIEPAGGRDVADVIEFALTHLMEFRYFDDVLDQRLTVLYDAIGLPGSGLFGGRFRRLSHEASIRFIEFSEVIERVENSLKVVGDFYLATIFRAAAARFRLHDWEESIKGKMNLLARVSELLQGELNVRRSLILEAVIVLLIAFEIVSALVNY